MVFESGDKEKMATCLMFNVESEAKQEVCVVQRWCVLRVVFIVDSLQLPNVQVSDALQMFKFCLDLCFLLHGSTESCDLPQTFAEPHRQQGKHSFHQEVSWYLFQMTNAKFEDLLLLVIFRQWQPAWDTIAADCEHLRLSEYELINLIEKIIKLTFTFYSNAPQLNCLCNVG